MTCNCEDGVQYYDGAPEICHCDLGEAIRDEAEDRRVERLADNRDFDLWAEREGML